MKAQKRQTNDKADFIEETALATGNCQQRGSLFAMALSGRVESQRYGEMDYTLTSLNMNGFWLSINGFPMAVVTFRNYSAL